MICGECGKEINKKNPNEYFVSFMNGNWLHFKCFELKERKRNGSVSRTIQSS